MWLIHPKPKDSELLSSWILRTCEMMALKPHSFCHRHWPGLQIWNRDIDRLAPAELLRGMADGTGVPLERAEQTTLRFLEGVVVERLAKGNDSVITNVGVYHRKRTGYGLRYCPICFGKPDGRYFRQEWRLLSVSTCPDHGVMLRDDCECGAPIVPGRGSMANCHQCEERLSSSKITTASTASLQLDAHSIAVLAGAPVSLPFLKDLHSIAYFALLSRLLLVLACGPRRERLWAALAKQGIEVPNPVFSRSSRGIRFLRANSISDLGPAIAFLLRGWPSMFAGLLAGAGIWKSWALRDAMPGGLPFCYEDAVRWYLTSEITPKSYR